MCTTMIFGRKATADRSLIVTHSDDDELSDQRVVRVPAMDHEPGAMRDVFAEFYDYPRIVSKDRGPGYDTPGWPETKAIGQIPQVQHTFAYYDGNYGIINEHGLMMGECTNGAKYQPAYVTAADAGEGKTPRLFYSSELSRIALERCRTAREAIKVMGELIDTYGYYSSGETLLVADDTEGWVFEMCALPSDRHNSAWIAQRVPDDEMFCAANTFRIREVPSATYEQIHPPYLHEALEELGWWDPAKGALDWLPAISEGEYNHPYYSLRRIWRVFDRVNPDLALSPWVEGTYTNQYPFSIKPRAPLDVRQIFDLYRDHYEGTEFDLTKGTAAGPYGDPHRFTGGYDGAQNSTAPRMAHGAWERAISVFYQGYTFVLQNRPDVADCAKSVMWFAPDVSYTSVFAPFYAKAADLPKAYQTGNTREYDRGAAWWVFDFVANWSRLNFQRMTKVDILPLQKELEAKLIASLAECDESLAGDPATAPDLMAAFSQKATDELLDRWRALGDMLIAKYSDGYVNPPPNDRRDPAEIGYSADWLRRTDYSEGPVTYEMKVRN